MVQEKINPAKSGEQVLNGIFEGREHQPDYFDTVNFMLGVLNDSDGFREAYQQLKTLSQQQKAEGRSHSREQSLLKLIEGFDRDHILEDLFKTSVPDQS